MRLLKLWTMFFFKGYPPFWTQMSLWLKLWDSWICFRGGKEVQKVPTAPATPMLGARRRSIEALLEKRQTSLKAAKMMKEMANTTPQDARLFRVWRLVWFGKLEPENWVIDDIYDNFPPLFFCLLIHVYIYIWIYIYTHTKRVLPCRIKLTCHAGQAPEEEQKEEPKHRKFKKARGRVCRPCDELCWVFGEQLESDLEALLQRLHKGTPSGSFFFIRKQHVCAYWSCCRSLPVRFHQWHQWHLAGMTIDVTEVKDPDLIDIWLALRSISPEWSGSCLLVDSQGSKESHAILPWSNLAVLARRFCSCRKNTKCSLASYCILSPPQDAFCLFQTFAWSGILKTLGTVPMVFLKALIAPKHNPKQRHKEYIF